LQHRADGRQFGQDPAILLADVANGDCERHAEHQDADGDDRLRHHLGTLQDPDDEWHSRYLPPLLSVKDAQFPFSQSAFAEHESHSLVLPPHAARPTHEETTAANSPLSTSVRTLT